MRIKYASDKVEKQCTDLKAAIKLFGGDKALALSLHARINSIKSAEVIKDIILMPSFHFHKLYGKLEGFFAIDVKSRKDKWRIILCLLDENEKEYNPCNIDEISGIVKVVRIEEVSPHYE